MKKLCLVLLIAAVALPLVGCSTTVHGGGRVHLLEGMQIITVGESWEMVDLEPGIVNFAITAMCSDRKDAMMSNIEWNDPTNGIRFHARLPWTSVSAVTNGQYSTCEELAAATSPDYPPVDGAVTVGYMNEQGQEIGDVSFFVGKANQGLPDDPCAGAPLIYVMGPDSEFGAPFFMAFGCLERGSLVFQ